MMKNLYSYNPYKIQHTYQMRFALFLMGLLLTTQKQLRNQQEIEQKKQQPSIVEPQNHDKINTPLPILLNIGAKKISPSQNKKTRQQIPDDKQLYPFASPSFFFPGKNPNITPPPLPFYCGKSYPKDPLPPYTKTQRQKPVQTIYGFNMYIDVKDRLISDMISETGTWQHDQISLLGHIVKPGHRVLNLGAQTGLEAIVMGKIVGLEGRVFVVQPYSFSCGLLRKNIQFNGLKDITTIYQIGASDRKQTGTINIRYFHTGGSEITPSSDNTPKTQTTKFDEKQQVQLDRIDSLLPEDIVLDFALLDVQKMEIQALNGMRKIIQRSPNLVIMTQWRYASNQRANKEETLKLLKFMFARGYKVYSYQAHWSNCVVGRFTPFENQTQLLKIQKQNIYFFPKTVPLPK